MEIRLIKTKAQHGVYMSEVCRLIAKPKRTHEEDEKLELLALVICDYENKTFPIEKPTPIEAIKFRMGQQGLRQKDMVPYFGHTSKASEILAGKLRLTVKMIRRLHNGLGIPLEVLIQEAKP